jgi:hypothetical protein
VDDALLALLWLGAAVLLGEQVYTLGVAVTGGRLPRRYRIGSPRRTRERSSWTVSSTKIISTKRRWSLMLSPERYLTDSPA